MLARLALGWPLLLIRAVFGFAMGIAALVSPPWSTFGFAFLIAAYALGDGALSLMLAVTAYDQRGSGALVFEALVRIGVGVFALALPGVTALWLMDVFAVWAFLSGAAAIAVAMALRRELSGEWPLPLAGVISIVCSLWPLIARGDAVDPRWVIGPYAMLFGFTLLALALRLRQLALEIAEET
jgi:uncharacterized membrane protein HdeD (DUF308 family)